MMKLFLKMALVAAIVISSAARAAELNEVETAYIWANVGTTMTTTFCGATEIPGGVAEMGGRSGIDVKLYRRAIIAAASAAIGMSYNREDLIPGVTEVYKLAQRTILDDLEKDKAETCDNWLSILRHVGTIR